MTTVPAERCIAAPQLRETADIWWDSDSDPIICWNAAGTDFWLADGRDADARLALVTIDTAPPDPAVVAAALRDGLAACDFPPTADGVSPARAEATLRVAGVDVTPLR